MSSLPNFVFPPPRRWRWIILVLWIPLIYPLIAFFNTAFEHFYTQSSVSGFGSYTQGPVATGAMVVGLLLWVVGGQVIAVVCYGL